MTITNLKKIRLSIFSLSLLFSLNYLPAYSQGGYQQPLDYDSDDSGYAGSPSRPLKGRVVVAPVGSRFSVSLASAISSEFSRIGDIVTASVSSPLVVGSSVVIPAGSQVIGQVVNAIPAARFMAGAGGVLEIRFTSIQTPDGQRFPLSASVDSTQFKLAAETGGSRVAKTVGKTAVGAGAGAALGTAISAISGGKKSLGRGAWSGAAIGGGIGALGALASKGKELVIQGGTELPITLDQSLQIVLPARQ